MKTGEELGPDLTPLKKTQNKPKKVKTAKTPKAKATEGFNEALAVALANAINCVLSKAITLSSYH
jgi:hypothetical protein